MHRMLRVFSIFLTWLRTHKHLVWGGLFVAALCVFAIGIPTHFTFAADTDLAAFGNGPVDQLVNVIAKLFNSIANTIGQLVLGLIGLILIPIINYNGFATSNIVGLGWSLVRDTVNMFVVVVLLVIAILTIVGSPKVNWQQQIPRLFIYVVMVNFSRTICGFLIDIGNVIMFQFVNALTEIGAGNFANLLKLNIAGDYSGAVDNTHAWQNLGAAYLQVALMTMILVIVGILAIVLIYRIVVLWVLIIMSPAAFFLGGIKDIFSQAGGAYGQWWKKFSSAIVLGPILTFFLWLALAASAGGDIVTQENFPIGDTENFGILLKVFDMSQLTGLLLGVVLLVVGMQQAASAAGALGGIASKLISEDMGFKIAKAGLRWPSTFGRGAYNASNYVAPELTAMGTSAAMRGAGGMVSYGATGLANAAGAIPVVGSLAATPFRKISEQGNKMYMAGAHIDEEQKKKARESLKHVPDSYKREVLRAMVNNEGAFTGLSKWQQEVMFEDLATKTGEQKTAANALALAPLPGASAEVNASREELGRRSFDRLMRSVITKTQEELDAGHSELDDSGKTNFKATKSQYLDVTFDALGREEATKYVTDPDSGFNPQLIRNRALNGQRGPGHLVQVRNALNRRVAKEIRAQDGTIQQVSTLHEIERGNLGLAKADAAGVGVREIENLNARTIGPGLPVYVRPADYGIEGLDPRDRPTPPATPGGNPANPAPGRPRARGNRPGGGGGAGGPGPGTPPPPPRRGGGGGRGRGGAGGGAAGGAGGGAAGPSTGSGSATGGGTTASANNASGFSSFGANNTAGFANAGAASNTVAFSPAAARAAATSASRGRQGAGAATRTTSSAGGAVSATPEREEAANTEPARATAPIAQTRTPKPRAAAAQVASTSAAAASRVRAPAPATVPQAPAAPAVQPFARADAALEEASANNASAWLANDNQDGNAAGGGSQGAA